MIDLDNMERLARNAYLADERSIGFAPGTILDLIGLARAAADSLPKIKEGSPAPADTRQQFEAWARKAEPGYHLDWNGSARRAQRYYVDRTQHAYEGFCAALALSGAAPASQAAAPADLLETLYRWLARAKFESPVDESKAALFGARIKEALAGAAPVEAAKPRQRFETWAKQNPTPYDLRESKYIGNGARTYLQDRTQWAFESFCGALGLSALPAAPAPEAQ